MTSIQVRGAVTIVLWLSYLGMIIFAMGSLGIWVALLAFVLMMPLIVIMGATWGMFGNRIQSSEEAANDTEKRKRERIDTVLRDLSDDDLVALRQRLQDGSIDDELLYDQLVGDDGEMVQGYDK